MENLHHCRWLLRDLEVFSWVLNGMVLLLEEVLEVSAETMGCSWNIC